MKRTTPLRRRTPLRPRRRAPRQVPKPPYLTADTERQAVDHPALVAWHEARTACLVRDAWACIKCRTTIALDVHHRAPRGMGGSSFPTQHSLDKLITLCRSCHDFVETHRTLAYFNGWLIPRGIDPATVPTHIGARWYLLHPDGTRTQTRPPTEI